MANLLCQLYPLYFIFLGAPELPFLAEPLDPSGLKGWSAAESFDPGGIKGLEAA